MHAPRRGVAVAVSLCVCAVGVLVPTAVAGTSVSHESEPMDPPMVDGTKITWTYRGDSGKAFFEGGYKMAPNLQANVASIDCGQGGEQNPAGGPDGALECGYHPPVTEAAIVLTGKEPWFDVSKMIVLTPFTSYDDKGYEVYKPVTIKAPASDKLTKAEAGAAYLEAVKPVNDAITAYKAKAAAWTDKTKGTQAAKDGTDLDKALDAVVTELKKLKDQYEPAAKAIKAQIKAVKALQGDITAAGALNEGLDKAKFDKQLDDHIDKLSKASDKVRTKLGLPAPNAGQQQNGQPAGK